MNNCIEKQIELHAPQSRVWQALVDHRQFGEWFGVSIEQPFALGKVSRGHITHPGYEHLIMAVTVLAIEPQRLFAYSWHPYAVDPTQDYSHETPTRVEFTLQPSATGTLLRLVESGFENVPAARRAEAFRMNEGGWSAQMSNIERYLGHGTAA